MRKFILTAFAGLAVFAAEAGLSTESMYLYWNAASKSVVGFTYVQLMYTMDKSSYSEFADGAYAADAYDENGNLLGSSDILAYNDVAESIYAEMGVGEGAFTPTDFMLNIPGPIPEPTSGLLLLLGVAGLALRRKTR